MSTYQPSAPPQDVRQIPAWLNREMLALKQAQERAQPHLTWEYLAAEPSKIVAGMEVLADGTNWDPGSIGVAAKYRRSEDNTTWELIEAIVVAAALAAHLADTSDAHDASAISILDAAGDFTATDVEGALAELQSDHEADAQALADHIADTTAAHAASAISFTPVGTIAATDAQTAIAEVATDAAAALAAHEAAADPHPGYLTPAEGNAAYQPLDADLTAIAAVATTAYGRGLLALADSTALAGEVDAFFLTPAEGNAAYQPLDADLTSWAGVARAAGFDTLVATPTSANLRSFLTDESGTGAAYFQGGDLGTPSAGVLTNATGTASGLTAGIASTVSIADEAADTTCFPLFGTAASGNLQPKTNANITFNASTGVFTSASLVATTADINGGTVDNTTIGATTATTGKFTTIESTGNVGFGSAPSASFNLSVTGSLTGAASASGMRNIPVVQSGVTGTAQYFVTSGGTAAAAFTCSSLHHYVAIQGTIGAGSTVTTQRGFLADSTLTGATTNYGFVGNIAASGTSRYNFYAGGTAPNHFTGNTTFGAKFGYGVTSGVGGTVTQATSKSTGVTLNTATGEITMNGAALAAATIVSFTMTNSTIEAADVLILNHVTTGTRGAYTLNAQCAAGSAIIYVRNNTAGSLPEAIVIRFAAVRGAIA